MVYTQHRPYVGIFSAKDICKSGADNLMSLASNMSETFMTYQKAQDWSPVVILSVVVCVWCVCVGGEEEEVRGGVGLEILK